MTDARKACQELCEVSRLALFLARMGRASGLHHKPLFLHSAMKEGDSIATAIHEQNDSAYGKRLERNQKL